MVTRGKLPAHFDGNIVVEGHDLCTARIARGYLSSLLGLSQDKSPLVENCELLQKGGLESLVFGSLVCKPLNLSRKQNVRHSNFKRRAHVFCKVSLPTVTRLKRGSAAPSDLKHFSIPEAPKFAAGGLP